MMNEPTKDKLYQMRLAAMAVAWQEQQNDPAFASLGFDERFGLLVDAEYLARDNRRLQRLIKDAQFRLPHACLEDVEAASARGVDKWMQRPKSDPGQHAKSDPPWARLRVKRSRFVGSCRTCPWS